MRRFTVSTIVFLLLAGGCTSDPVMQVSEVRAWQKEALVQVNEAKTDPTADQAKVRDLEGKLLAMEPFIGSLEVLAAQSKADPGKMIEFHALWYEVRPKVQALLMRAVLRKYLGV